MKQVVRCALLVMIVTLVAGSSGCAVKRMSRVGEAAATLPFVPLGIMPSWDVPRDSNQIEGPGPRRSSPIAEFFMGVPLFPLFLPSWEEPIDHSKGAGWWAHRVSSPDLGAEAAR